jgi:hypothetical protein
MDFLANLNKRHKVALFLTLLAAGTSLVLGVAAKQTAGIVLFGIAFAWALGSNNPPVHVSFIVLGLFLAMGPVVRDWYGQRNEMKKYRESVVDFERRIPELATLYPTYVGLASTGEGQDIRGLEDIRVNRAAAKLSLKRREQFDPVAAFKARFEGGEDQSDEKVRAYLSDPARFRRVFPEYKSWDDAKISGLFQQKGHQYVKMPDGSYGEFPADATDQEIIVAIERRVPGTFDRYLKMPDGKYWAIRLTPKDGPDAQARRIRTQFAEQFPNLPKWHIDALLGGVDVDTVPSYEEPSPQPEPFSLSLVLTTNWMFDLLGLSLSVIGLGLLLLVKSETSSTLK